MKPSAVAVLDVGKTNKKIRLYDRAFAVLGEERTVVNPKEVQGVEVEDTEALLAWFRDALAKLSPLADVRAIAITTHGATAALLDGNGKLAFPVVSYTAARGAEVQETFYAEFGDRTDLHRATCTPDLGFANVGKSLYFVKTKRPEVWGKVRHALFYPAYLGYELTGKLGLESTYLGNHTYLWDYAAQTWSAVGRALGADRLFPQELRKPWECLGTLKPELAAACGVSADCKVTLGIHDSNANLLPYLAQGYDNFILNSTGTWCVLMRPSSASALTEAEIAAKVLFNLDALGRPVATCIFPAGMEYDTFRGFTALRDESTADLARRVIAERKLFVIPGVLPDASAFPGATPRVVAGVNETTLETLRARNDRPMTALGQNYCAALNLSLALATRRSLESAGVAPRTRVFIEGGFANNHLYCELLAALCPGQTFALTSMKEGTSFGAALTGWMLAEDLSLESIGNEFTIDATDVPRLDFGDLDAYEDAFMELAAAR